LFIPELRRKFGCKVGYSGHEVGLITTVAAVALGATSVERHLTLDRAMYGSDQSASVEVTGFHKLVSYIRTVEVALGEPKKVVYASEAQAKQKLRKVETLFC
jgi:N-acetylneuraminate synthase